MTGSFFRRFFAAALIGIALFAAGIALAGSHAGGIVAAIFGAVVLAAAAAALLSRSLRRRLRNLRVLAEKLPGGGSKDRHIEESADELVSLERSLAGAAIELQKILDRLRDESARREAILSGMAEGVLAVDHDLRVMFSNARFLEAVDFRGANFEGLFLLEVVRDTGLHELLRSVVLTGDRRWLRFRLSPANARTFEARATPLEMPSGRGAVAILHDITEIERLEQVRKDFVANVSHELRTPLAGIIGYADTLLDGALEDVANSRRFLEIIRGNAVRLNNIASDLLTLSQLESDRKPAETEVVQVRVAVESAAATLAAEAAAREVRVFREEVQDIYIIGSRLGLEQAILNLMANAIKFNRPGGEVRVRAASASRQVEISIADTGTGIPSQDLPRIFERFYRVDRARSRQVGGTGLGLSIVKHAIERMNGTVKVESQLGRGSTFTLTLPKAESRRL
ncbi:MAG: sensor histidine kinase [Bryobacteraceae bacterium]